MCIIPLMAPVGRVKRPTALDRDKLESACGISLLTFNPGFLRTDNHVFLEGRGSLLNS